MRSRRGQNYQTKVRRRKCQVVNKRPTSEPAEILRLPSIRNAGKPHQHHYAQRRVALASFGIDKDRRSVVRFGLRRIATGMSRPIASERSCSCPWGQTCHPSRPGSEPRIFRPMARTYMCASAVRGPARSCSTVTARLATCGSLRFAWDGSLVSPRGRV
jgi:hypothetical protein